MSTLFTTEDELSPTSIDSQDDIFGSKSSKRATEASSRAFFKSPYINVFQPFSQELVTKASLCVLIYYLSELYSMKINWSWFVLLWVLCTIFSMSLPPVSGGTLVCLGVLMATFGIPKEGLALAGTLAIIIDFIDTSSRVLTSDLIMLGAADKLDKLDLEALRSPAK